MSWLGRLLCRLGRHRWIAFDWPQSERQYRRCARCGIEQYWVDAIDMWLPIPQSVTRARRKREEKS